MKMILIAIMISFYEWFDDSNGDAYGYYSGYELIWIVWFELCYFFVGFYNVYNVCLEWTYTLQLPECQWTPCSNKVQYEKIQLSVGLRTKWLWVQVSLQILLVFIKISLDFFDNNENESGGNWSNANEFDYGIDLVVCIMDIFLVILLITIMMILTMMIIMEKAIK